MATIDRDPRQALQNALASAMHDDPKHKKEYQGLSLILVRCMAAGACKQSSCPMCLKQFYLEPIATELEAQFRGYDSEDLRYVVFGVPGRLPPKGLRRSVDDLKSVFSKVTRRGGLWATAVDRWAGMLHPFWDDRGQGNASGFTLRIRTLAHCDRGLDPEALGEEWMAALKPVGLDSGDLAECCRIKQRPLHRAVKLTTRVDDPLPLGFDAMPAAALIPYLDRVPDRRRVLGRKTLSPAIQEAVACLKKEASTAWDGIPEL